MQLKERFLNAVLSGELGRRDEQGIIVELREFKKYFSDVPANYAHTFLPAATIEIGQSSMSHTKFLFRVQKGVYRLHPDAINLISFEHAFRIETPDSDITET